MREIGERQENILEVRELQLAFLGVNGRVEALRGVNLAVAAGEIVALVGESGSGKTALCRAALGLHANHAVIEHGGIWLAGQDTSNLTEKDWCALRGCVASMVFQDPMSAFDPVYPIGQQIAEVLLLHPACFTGSAEAETVALLAKLGFDEPARRARQYPHEFSGGMLQRAAIALAMIAKPRLLIADEPTTALDIETQQEIMALLRESCARQDCSMLFVTHDLGLAEQIADRIMVMKDGRIVEEGQSEQIFRDPQHAYTKKLLGYAAYGKGGSHYHGRIRAAEQEEITQKETKQTAKKADDVLLSIRGLSKSFPLDKHTRKQVLHDVSLAIHRGEIVGLIGPSGVGKSTLARCIMGICAPDSGEMIVREGARIQMIFQDSAAAFNPHMTIAEIIAEPLVLQARRQRRTVVRRCFAKAAAGCDAADKHAAGAGHTDSADSADVQSCTRIVGKMSKAVLREKVLAVMRQAEIEPELADRYPYDVSGGQRQRAAIARALITEPDLIICDEPISSLDVSLQADIIHLLKKLQEERGLSLLLISHDLPMVEHISDRIVKLQRE